MATRAGRDRSERGLRHRLVGQPERAAPRVPVHAQERHRVRLPRRRRGVHSQGSRARRPRRDRGRHAQRQVERANRGRPRLRQAARHRQLARQRARHARGVDLRRQQAGHVRHRPACRPVDLAYPRVQQVALRAAGADLVRRLPADQRIARSPWLRLRRLRHRGGQPRRRQGQALRLVRARHRHLGQRGELVRRDRHSRGRAADQGVLRLLLRRQCEGDHRAARPTGAELQASQPRGAHRNAVVAARRDVPARKGVGHRGAGTDAGAVDAAQRRSRDRAGQTRCGRRRRHGDRRAGRCAHNRGTAPSVRHPDRRGRMGGAGAGQSRQYDRPRLRRCARQRHHGGAIDPTGHRAADRRRAGGKRSLLALHTAAARRAA